MSTEAEAKREYEAMTALDDVIGTLRECGWSLSDLVERVEAIVEDEEE